MNVSTRSNVFSKRVAAIGLSAIALLGGTVATVTTVTSASPAHASTHHPDKQHRTLPRGYGYREIKNPDCGKDQRAIIVWSNKSDSSVMICRNGSKVEQS